MEPPDKPDEHNNQNQAQHYFSDMPSSESKPTTVQLSLPDLTFNLQADSGIFSSDRIDPGTKILLMEVTDLPLGPILDLGCGYGPIATTMAKRYPSQEIWAIDVNSRARSVCQENLLTHADATTEFHVLSPEQVPADLQIAAIVSNPPIRIGKPALHALLTFWLDRLRQVDGVAWLVVHKHLGADSLSRWLENEGYASTKMRSRQGYRVLKVSQLESA
ncbi:MAG: methyltransferase [Microthrixaceae bacterium]